MQKIRFKDLSWGLKIAVVNALAWGVLWAVWLIGAIIVAIAVYGA